METSRTQITSLYANARAVVTSAIVVLSEPDDEAPNDAPQHEQALEEIGD